MSSVDSLVKQHILAYPSMNQNRTDVIHHILCVAGNGYTWQNGVPVGYEGETYEPWTEADTLRRFPDDENAPDVIRDIMAKIRKDSNDLSNAVVSTVDARVQDRGPLSAIQGTSNDAEVPVYPQTDIVLLMNVPDDVTDEWRAEVEWMKDFVSKRGWEFAS